MRARFGAAAAESFGQFAEVARQADAARFLEIQDAICQSVTLSENAEQFLAGLQSMRLESA